MPQSKNETNINGQNKPRSYYTFAIPKHLRDKADKVKSHYGYRRVSDAATNLMLVGLKVYEQNPDAFIKTLQQ